MLYNVLLAMALAGTARASPLGLPNQQVCTLDNAVYTPGAVCPPDTDLGSVFSATYQACLKIGQTVREPLGHRDLGLSDLPIGCACNIISCSKRVLEAEAGCNTTPGEIGAICTVATLQCAGILTPTEIYGHAPCCI